MNGKSANTIAPNQEEYNRNHHSPALDNPQTLYFLITTYSGLKFPAEFTLNQPQDIQAALEILAEQLAPLGLGIEYAQQISEQQFQRLKDLQNPKPFIRCSFTGPEDPPKQRGFRWLHRFWKRVRLIHLPTSRQATK